MSFLTVLVLLLGLTEPARADPSAEPAPRGTHGAQRPAGAPGAASRTPVIRDSSKGGRVVKAAKPRSAANRAAGFNESYGDDQLLTAPTQWWTVNGWTAEDILSFAQNQGARVSDIAVQQGTSQLRFTATLVKNAGPYEVRAWAMWHGLTEASVISVANYFSLRPVALTRYWTPDGWRFAAAMVDNTGDGARFWWWNYGDQNYVVGQQQATGARVTKVRPFDDGGTRRYDVLMASSGQEFWWWFGGGVDSVNNLIRQNGARIVDATRNSDGTFNAVLLRNHGRSPGWWYGFGHQDLNLKALRMGARLITAQGYMDDGSERFVGTMSQEAVGADLARAMVQNTVVHTGFAHGGAAVAELSDSTLGKVNYAFGTTADARTRIASVSKTFAAAELVKLAASGSVSLDAPVSRYLPGVVGGDAITLRMLLRHTSGLFDFTGGQPGDFGATMTQGFTYPQLLAIVNRNPLQFTPGSRYRYSNSNTLVAAMVIERVTGLSYPAALQRDILTPLNLTGTSVPTGTAMPATALRGYWWNPVTSSQLEVTGQNASRWAAGGQMVSTMSELNLFYKLLLYGWVTGSTWANEMKNSVVYTGEGSKYAALGMFRTTLGCGKTVYWHDGSIPGYRTWSVHSADGSRSLSWSYSDQRRGEVNFDDEFIENVFCNL
ncbi:serine hydrolase domain-containing protein [Spirillospora sp. NPDC050679]